MTDQLSAQAVFMKQNQKIFFQEDQWYSKRSPEIWARYEHKTYKTGLQIHG